MPSGPPELHEKWKNDYNPSRYLTDRGFTITRDWSIKCPVGKTMQDISDEEYEAAKYLQWEWDYGPIIDNA